MRPRRSGWFGGSIGRDGSCSNPRLTASCALTFTQIAGREGMSPGIFLDALTLWGDYCLLGEQSVFVPEGVCAEFVLSEGCGGGVGIGYFGLGWGGYDHVSAGGVAYCELHDGGRDDS